MKKFIPLGLLMSLLVGTLSGCGELRPEVADTYNRERQQEEERRKPPAIPTLVVNRITYDITGSKDLNYTASFNSGVNTFTFQVDRRLNEQVSKTVILSRADMPAEYDLLVALFAGKINAVLDTNCSTNCPNSFLKVWRSDTGTRSEVDRPYVQDGSNKNLFDELHTFISNRL